ncbi:MAG: PH domain-containing protein [Patescibacteria group bacterium]
MVADKDKTKYSRYLASGEEIIAIFKIGDKYFWMQTITSIPLILLLIGIPRLLKILHLRHAKTYILTNRRVLVKDGIFSTELTSAPYDKITHITVKEDFLPKIAYGIGDITIHTAGPTPVEIDLVKVFQPVKIKNLIEELMVKEKAM